MKLKTPAFLKSPLPYALLVVGMSGCSISKTAQEKRQEVARSKYDIECIQGKFFDKYHTSGHDFDFTHPKKDIAITKNYLQSIDKKEKIWFMVNKKDSTLYMHSVRHSVEGFHTSNIAIGKSAKEFDLAPVSKILWQEGLASFDKGLQPR